MRTPTTPGQWQAAVDAAWALRNWDAATAFGLVADGPEVNLSRCEEILWQGKQLGYEPSGMLAGRQIAAARIEAELSRRRIVAMRKRNRLGVDPNRVRD